jgi:hypothetical protein
VKALPWNVPGDPCEDDNEISGFTKAVKKL